MKEEIHTIPSNRLQHFPIMMFAIVMGFSGLTIIFEKAYHILGFPKIIATALATIDTILFFTIIVFYLLKILKYKEEVKKEFSHPVRINFFAASSISFLLMAIVYKEYCQSFCEILFFIGMIGQTFFTFYTISFWINKNLQMNHSNPAWFIPIVGNVLVPVAGAGIVSNDVLMYYFSIGMFFWIVLTSILINRIIFHNQLAVKFIPTLFIFIAPPSVAFLAYMKMFNTYDVFAMFLFNLSIFFAFLIIFMYKNFLNLKFFISWWAFTFPLAAVTLASMSAYHTTKIQTYLIFTYIFMIATIVIIAIVATKTIAHIRKKEICINE